jgi:hypothetical protein
MRSLLCGISPDKNTRDCRNTPRYATINWPIQCGWDHDYQVREKGYPCRRTAVLSRLIRPSRFTHARKRQKGSEQCTLQDMVVYFLDSW